MQRKKYIFSLLLGSFFILFNSCEKHSEKSKEANQQTVIEGKSIKSKSFQANDFVQLLKSVNPGLKTPIVSEVHFYPDGKFEILYLENDKRYSAAITFDYFEGGTFALVSYADANNNQSTYGLLDDGNEITTIDCQGSCDCKEQYIHSTGGSDPMFV